MAESTRWNTSRHFFLKEVDRYVRTERNLTAYGGVKMVRQLEGGRMCTDPSSSQKTHTYLQVHVWLQRHTEQTRKDQMLVSSFLWGREWKQGRLRGCSL